MTMIIVVIIIAQMMTVVAIQSIISVPIIGVLAIPIVIVIHALSTNVQVMANMQIFLHPCSGHVLLLSHVNVHVHVLVNAYYFSP